MGIAVRPFRSLRARIAFAAPAAILAAVVLLAAVTVLLVDHELRASLDSALRQRAQEVAELAISTPAVLTDPGALESPVSGRQISVEVIDRRGRLLARSLNLGARILPEDALERAARVHGRTGSENIVLDGHPLRDREVHLKSADPAVARVDPEGRVWPISPGDVVVKANIDDKEGEIAVHVRAK